MYNIEKQEQARSPFAVATARAKEEGHVDFSEGGSGARRRSELAEAIKREQNKSVLSKVFIELYSELKKFYLQEE